jgi:hypothetical protein
VHDGYLHILQASAKLLQDHHHEEIKSKTITTKRKRSGLVRGDGDKILFASVDQSKEFGVFSPSYFLLLNPDEHEHGTAHLIDFATF